MAKQPAKTAEKPKEDETPQGLHGTNSLPAMVDLAPGKSVQLGEIVMAAHVQSGLSAKDWNALPQTDRDNLLHKVVEDLRADPTAANYPRIQAIISRPLEHIQITPMPDPIRFSALADEVKARLEGNEAGSPPPLAETSQMILGMVAEQVLIVSAPAGPRRRAGFSFGPNPVELRGEDLGDDPERTIEALRADPLLKLDYRFEQRPADETD